MMYDFKDIGAMRDRLLSILQPHVDWIDDNLNTGGMTGPEFRNKVQSHLNLEDRDLPIGKFFRKSIDAALKKYGDINE